MAVNCSTGFRTRILGATAFESIFNGGSIEIRSGPQPASADMAATGSLLGRITNAGNLWVAGNPANGLRFVRNGPRAQSDPSQDWRLRGEAPGAAGWFRLVANAPDNGLESLTLPRADGAIGHVDAFGDFQLRLPTTAMSDTTVITIPLWWFAFPPL